MNDLTHSYDPGTRRLTPLGERVCAAMVAGEVYQRIDLARRLGIGRGSAYRIVDKLCNEGVLVVIDGGVSLAVAPSSRQTVADRILATLSDGPKRHGEIRKRLPDANTDSVSSTLTRLHRDRKILKSPDGFYVVNADNPTLEAGTKAVQRVILDLEPGTNFKPADILERCPASYIIFDNAVKTLLKMGEIHRHSRGLYVRSGRSVDVGIERLSKIDMIRQILASEDRVWKWSEIQEKLDVFVEGIKVLWVLNNAYKRSDPTIVRVSKGYWRIGGNSTPPPAPRESLKRMVLDILGRGGIWSEDEMQASLPPNTRNPDILEVLKELEVEGVAVPVALSYWRDRATPVGSLARPGLIASMIVLLAYLRSWPRGIGSAESSALTGLSQRFVISKLQWLRVGGYVVNPSHGLNLCTDATATGMAHRLRQIPHLPHLSDIGVKLIRSFVKEEELTMEELARRVDATPDEVRGIVDRLLSEGRLALTPSGLLVRG